MSGNVPIPRSHSSNRHVAAFPCIESIITENMKITIQKFYRNYSQYPAMVGNVFPSKFITWTCGRAFGNTESIIINQRDLTKTSESTHCWLSIFCRQTKRIAFLVFLVKRCDEQMKVAWWLCPDQSREQRGDKCENTQRANLSDSKDKSAITAQENTDQPLLSKSAITIKQIVIFAISPNFLQHSDILVNFTAWPKD